MPAQDRIEITEEDYHNQEVSMADAFRENGKIYVVVLVICVVLGGVLTYMFIIDRKLSKLEKEM